MSSASKKNTPGLDPQVQVLCGSVYQQVGVLVTVFMAGLALGALLANQRPNLGWGSLSLLALAIAAYASLLLFVLPLLDRMGGSAASLVLVKASVAAQKRDNAGGAKRRRKVEAEDS